MANDGSSVGRIAIQAIDLRGEPEGKVRRYLLLPIACRTKIELKYEQLLESFFQTNMHFFEWSNPNFELHQDPKKEKATACIFILDKYYGETRLTRGVLNVINKDVLTFRYYQDRPNLLILWVDIHYPGNHELAGFQWVAFTPNKMKSATIQSVSNPFQSVVLSLRLQ